MTDSQDSKPRPKRTSITFPAELNKRGTGYYITVMKPYRSMLGIEDGDIIDVTISRTDVPEQGESDEQRTS